MCLMAPDCCSGQTYQAMFNYFKDRVTASNYVNYIHANITSYIQQNGYPCPNHSIDLGTYELSLRDDFSKYYSCTVPECGFSLT